MIEFLRSLRDGLLAVASGLREPRFYAALLAALVLWSLAYQQKIAYSVDVGGLEDDAYVSGFNAKEHNDTLDYRWSGASSAVRFPGIGNEPVYLTVSTIGYRPSGPPPQVTILARGQQFTLHAHPEPHDDTFFLDRGDRFDGGVTVRIESPTFSPQGDPRQLGVIVDRVSVAPPDGGLRPLVIPSLTVLASMLLAVVLVYLSIAVTLRRRSPALFAIYLLILIVVLLVLYARPELGLLAQVAPVVALWSLGLAFVGRGLLDVVGVGDTAAGWGGLAFAAAFALRFGGVLYPQFLTSDIILHVHNLQSVLKGEWLFTEPLPDGTPAPYPTSMYVLLSPLTLLTGTHDAGLSLLLKWSGSLFDAVTCLALAWAGGRLWGPKAGALASLAYAFSPAVFELLSAGNYTNLFAQAALSCTLLAALVYLRGRSRLLSGARGAALLGLGLMLTMLGHYGVMLAAVAVAGLFLLWALWRGLRRDTGATRAWAVLGAAGVALFLSFALYYRHFTAEMWAQWSGLFGKLMGSGSAPARPTGSAASGQSGVLDFVGRRSVLVGPLLAICAAGGGLLGLRSVGRSSLRPYAALLIVWVLAAVVFAALDRVVGDTVRWAYLAAAALALVAGRFLAPFLGRGAWPRLLVALILITVLWTTLAYWVGDLIFTRYH